MLQDYTTNGNHIFYFSSFLLETKFKEMIQESTIHSELLKGYFVPGIKLRAVLLHIIHFEIRNNLFK